MSLDEWVSRDTVDPEVRAHIYSLVSAVGGSSIEQEGRYVLGDDALACLKDLRRWLRLYDQRLNRHDVARCLAEADVVKGDLCEILGQWTEERTNHGLKPKAALACMEILVPITWPLQLAQDEATVNHHRHIPYLQLAQTKYKRVILQHPAKILRTAVRLALPSMAEPRRERNNRDNGIISIILYFIRNIALITHPPNLPEDDNAVEISRSATIDAFHYQDIFQLLLTVSSSIGDEFVDQDVIVIEILFHLLKGVDVEKLFMEEEKLASSNTNELRDLIQKEKAMHAGYAKHAPTRHNRFGTMIWVKRDDEKVSTVSGQDVLASGEKSLQKMDKTKKWNKPRYTGGKRKDDSALDEFDKKIPLDTPARKHLRNFVEEFLDSSFNPLFTHVRKAIDNEAERVLTATHPRQFCYLVSWFLQAACARRAKAKRKAAQANASTTAEEESFALIASVMNQETFVFLNRFMQRCLDEKSWRDLNAGMKCFTEILQTVQEMSESPMDEDQEISENIQNRIFYEETTHDRIVTLLRSYKDQGLGYLDACTELSHVFIRMLERYSKQNVDLQVRSRRRARKKAKATAQANGDGDIEDQGDGEDDVVAAHRTTSERRFDFARFQARFSTQGCVDTFVAFTRYYNDLSVEQLKRAHRFFYRVAFKLEMGIMLYRVDILRLFQKMINGPDGLDRSLPLFKEWEELIRQVFRRCIKKVQERPELIVEMLFSKIPATTYYLEHGHDKELTTRTPRPPAELEVKGDMDKNGQIGVAVSLLINQNKSDHLTWVKKILSSAAEERSAWEQEQEARKAMTLTIEGKDTLRHEDDAVAPFIMVKPDHEERRAALFKDNKLRLLLKILGFMRTGLEEDPDGSWIIPSALTSEELRENERSIQQAEWEPPSFGEDKSAEDMIRTKRQRVTLRGDPDDEDDGPDALDALDDEELFPAGGPTATRAEALKELKRKRSRRKRTVSEEPDDAEKERRRELRRQRELEKRRKIKSELFVHSSDEETDEEADREFFAAEEERRKKTAGKIARALISASIHETASKKRKSINNAKKSRKRRKGPESGSEDDGPAPESRSSSEEPVSRLRIVSDDEQEEDEDSNTPLSSQHAARDAAKETSAEAASPAIKDRSDVAMQDADDAEDDEVPVRKAVRRGNVRAGFLVDSDSE
ncbi:timeless protein-domain-containing protein [Macrophomina phaseolina]|uniref:Topoisomerase 1-associated factor 1 n=1 Tax=Macrophomina phaseolina TaxID=35725 RepID=A0ABQ8G9C0_9PEZI|nr:timeless protein-domain-containing protein [Macrophomina phaseolina]